MGNMLWMFMCSQCPDLSQEGSLVRSEGIEVSLAPLHMSKKQAARQ